MNRTPKARDARASRATAALATLAVATCGDAAAIVFDAQRTLPIPASCLLAPLAPEPSSSPSAPRNAPAAQNAPSARPHAIDESMARVFRDLRIAEAAGDRDAIARLSAARGEQAVRDRAALATRAIAQRAAARSAAERDRTERALFTERQALAVQLATREPDCARELWLECDEDALFRLLTIDAADAAVAVALPEPAQVERARAASAVVAASRAALRESLSAEAAIATDPAALRAHVSLALARLIDADLAQLDRETAGDDGIAREASGRERAARDEAAQLLARAAKSEQTLSPDLAAVLALARARAADTGSPARTALLGEAARATDPVVQFLARFEAWRDGGMREPFTLDPNAPLALEILAATAEARARRIQAAAAGMRGDQGRANEKRADLSRASAAELAAIAAPFERLLDRTLARSAARSDEAAGERARRFRTVASALALRFDAPMCALAARNDAPATLAALRILHDADDARRDFVRAHRETALRAAAAPPLAAIVAPIVARQLALAGDAAAAADLLERVLASDAVGSVFADEAPALADALLATRRALASGAGGEAALDRALELAIPRSADAETRHARILERVDLVLFARERPGNPDLAAQMLLSLPNEGAVKPLRELRSIEADLARLPARGAVEQAKELSRRASILDATIAVEAARNPELRLAVDRISVVDAALALREGRTNEALRFAARALELPLRDQRTAERAARIAIAAAASRDGTFLDDGPLAQAFEELASKSPAIREALADPLRSARGATEDAWIAGDRAKAARIARERLAPMTQLAQRAPRGSNGNPSEASDPIRSPSDAWLASCAALAKLAVGDAADALRLARAATAAAEADDATARWILAEALLAPNAGGAEDAAATRARRAEAFAILRELAPATAEPAARDRMWWTAQVALLEILADDPARRTDALARLNRVTAQDAANSFGGAPLDARVRALRQRLEGESHGAR